MAIVVLVLWLFTAGAGFYMLITSSLGLARFAASPASAGQPAAPSAGPGTPGGGPGTSGGGPGTSGGAPDTPSGPLVSATQATLVTQDTPASSSPSAAAARSASAAPAPASLSRRERRRAAGDPFAPPSLIASRQAPIVPDLRSVAEFAHPACAISGLGFWLGFTLVHFRVLGWIAFVLIVATACIGLAWFTANTRAARRSGAGRPAPSFTGRLIVVHGGAAAVTLALAALTILVIRG